MICSDHSPEDVEHKNLEFGRANFGITGLETLFGLAVTHLSKILTLDELINKISINPRTILRVDVPIIKEGFEANLTLFDPAKEWTFYAKNSKSKSKTHRLMDASWLESHLASTTIKARADWVTNLPDRTDSASGKSSSIAFCPTH